ncbi:YlmH family RNA-binding protein [Alicyclobacillus fastidiosus]|uniref:YlmH/Sll1252 family protein n=1 Tax=Alicyclobacillus fastidiosus TaxID=392011 RepID=A0ABV5AH22_9BACL|nr:YlmH/Sll1252 family protein [Alicyclobacillus fastidiosus]WEH08104.1 YlmH/Sll1252 family protein [Alicyclobacillus fastidiosus]
MSSTHDWVRDSERPFARTSEDWCNQVEARGQWYLTDFLTPREEYLATSVAGRRGVVVEAFGGYAHAERRRLLLMPGEWYPQAQDFAIECLELNSLEGSLRHKDVLGSVLGLGLQRKMLGDIAVVERKAYVFVAESVANFLYESLSRVGRSTVTVTKAANLPDLPAPAYDEKDVSVASLRLDAIVSHACQMSRAKAQAAVERGDVTLNFAPASNRDEVAEGDLLSVRGFGRVKILQALGATRRDRMRIRVGILRSNA